MGTRIWFTAAIAAMSALAAPAFADASFTLDTYVGADIAPAGPYGTVLFIENGANVDVSVTLADGVQGFTKRGLDGPDVLLFDLDIFPGVTIENISAGYMLDEAELRKSGKIHAINSPDTGKWLYGIQCVDLCNAGNPISAPLSFTVDDVIIADFVPNDAGNIFSADLCIGATGRKDRCIVTGDVLASRDPPAAAPEPATLALFGAGLLGLGGLTARRRQAARRS